MKANRIFFSIIMCSVFLQVGLSTEIFIYNQNMAFIQDQSSLELSNKGDVSFILNGLPENTIPSSILIESDCIDIISHEFIHNPPTLENILESFVGKKIQLVRYGDDGNIASSRDGLLLSTRPSVMFEIDGRLLLIRLIAIYFHTFPMISQRIRYSVAGEKRPPKNVISTTATSQPDLTGVPHIPLRWIPNKWEMFQHGFW